METSIWKLVPEDIKAKTLDLSEKEVKKLWRMDRRTDRGQFIGPASKVIGSNYPVTMRASSWQMEYDTESDAQRTNHLARKQTVQIVLD